MDLDVLVGEWTAEARFSFTPEPVSGRMSVAWDVGGAFLVQRSTAEHPDAPDCLAVIAPDGEAYVQHYFDSRGVVRVYRMTLRDNEWTLLRDQPDFSPLDFAQRYVGAIGEDGRTITGRWETSQDGGATWELDFDLDYRKD
ncbi:hypothetical protein GCM10009836_21490 [Pseudonocardia ailaonensis]|uniref:DUF1579 domain-containing protein n=1 Tax=Pseudonocardia ailaonensis TaxID=367279 RepID=A0ABN2MWJ4_9PSEU